MGFKSGQSAGANTSPAAVAAPMKRRGLVLGVGGAGAAAIAAQLLPGAPAGAMAPVAGATVPAASDGGYRLSAHVLRYYDTARS